VSNIASRPRQSKPALETDEDGFTKISGTGGPKQTGRSTTPKMLQGRGAPIPTKQPYSALASESRAATTPEPISIEKFERRIKSLRSDFINDGGNINEMILSFDELLGVKDAETKFVTKNTDDSMECKEVERRAIVRILSVLFEKGRLSQEHVKDGLSEVIEFIDSIAVDAPRAYEYLGQIVGEMARVTALDLPWLCEQLQKAKDSDDKSKAPSKVVSATLKSLKEAGGSSSVQSSLKDSESALEKLLGPDEWRSISNSL